MKYPTTAMYNILHGSVMVTATDWHMTQRHAVGMGETAARLNKNKNNSLANVKFPLNVQLRPRGGLG